MTKLFSLRRAACLVCIALCAGPAFAQTVKKYANPRFGYSLEYPAGWHFTEKKNQIDLSYAEGGFSAETDNCGVTLLVDKLSPGDEGAAEKILNRIAGGDDQALDFEGSSKRSIGGGQWLAVPYTDTEHGRTGVIYVLAKGAVAYLIGSYFTSPEVQEKFQPVIDDLLDSFAFAPVDYKAYRDKKRGVSFRLPEGVEVNDRGDEIKFVLAGEDVDADGFGAAVSLGAFSATDKEFKDLDEKGVFRKLEELFSEGSEFGEPERVKLAKTDWYRGEATREGGKITIYLRKSGAYFFGVVLIVRPISAESEYTPIFNVFLKSLSIDFKKWAASMAEEETEED
ncbi:MAG: hypothetical protein JXD23_01020 [Spirochaetales bacterium]|nr:hypothetical protein [Spirochaetales bacterium]